MQCRMGIKLKLYKGILPCLLQLMCWRFTHIGLLLRLVVLNLLLKALQEAHHRVKRWHMKCSKQGSIHLCDFKVMACGKPPALKTTPSWFFFFSIASGIWNHVGGRFIIHYQNPLAREVQNVAITTICHKLNKNRHNYTHQKTSKVLCTTKLLWQRRGILLVHNRMKRTVGTLWILIFTGIGLISGRVQVDGFKSCGVIQYNTVIQSNIVASSALIFRFCDW